MAGERQKLNLSGMSKSAKRIDPDALREVSKEHGFESRDPESIRQATAEVQEPEAAPRQPISSPVAGPVPATATPQASPVRFRRPGRPASDRMIAVNVRLSQETADFLYRVRDANPRYTLADVLDDLVALYRDHGPKLSDQ